MYSDGDRQPSIGSLQDTLQHIIQGFDQAYIIINSLDECAERDDLLSWIEKIAGWKVGKVRLLVTSRQEPNIEDRIDAVVGPGRVSVASESANGDIETYINARLSSEFRHVSSIFSISINPTL